MTPALAELVRRSCLCSDGLCAACTQIVAALEQGERLRAAAEKHCQAFEKGSIPGGALIVGDLRAALHGQEPAADAE